MILFLEYKRVTLSVEENVNRVDHILFCLDEIAAILFFIFLVPK